MSMLEFIEQQLHELFTDLTERIANGEFGEMSEDDMCSIPLFIFAMENCLFKALALFFAKKP